MTISLTECNCGTIQITAHLEVIPRLCWKCIKYIGQYWHLAGYVLTRKCGSILGYMWYILELNRSINCAWKFLSCVSIAFGERYCTAESNIPESCRNVCRFLNVKTNRNTISGSKFDVILQPWTHSQYVPLKRRYSPTGVHDMNNVLRKNLETYLRPDRCFILKYIYCKISLLWRGS